MDILISIITGFCASLISVLCGMIYKYTKRQSIQKFKIKRNLINFEENTFFLKTTPYKPGLISNNEKLVVQQNGNEIAIIPLINSETIFGRNEGCDVVIHSKLISRIHFSITITNKHAILKNLGTTNGIMVNETYIGDSIILKSGDNISIGNISFEFCILN